MIDNQNEFVSGGLKRPLTRNSEYAEPQPGGPFSPANGGYSVPLRRGLDTPDDMRLRRVTPRETYSGENDGYYESRTDSLVRENYATDVGRFEATEYTTSRSAARDPRAIPVGPQRRTERDAPLSGHFYRDMNAGLGPKRFTGIRRSMATRRRDYEIYGMRPATTARTTYRREIMPYTAAIIEEPDQPLAYQIARVAAVVPTERRRLR